MKIIKSWLAQYLPELNGKTDQELSDILQCAGIEVEGIETGLHDNIVVAKIISVEKHPDADRLSLASVTDGVSNYEIICGAPNIKTGQIVPLAKIGAILPGGFEIQPAKIRGKLSHGMLCAADELGLSDDHTGIIEFPNEYEIGSKLSKYITKETIFDLSITPNRGDWLSHFGVAREIAAFLNTEIKKEPISLKEVASNNKPSLSVDIAAPKKCPLYMSRVIKGVKVAKSPLWLANRLEAVGVRSINNVVDVTNYLLLEYGHPLHAFDYHKIAGQAIMVRNAQTAETITTLDGNTQTLNSSDLVIAGTKGPIAIAGVMGGANSEVSLETVDVVLEAALFDPISIRKTAKRLKMQTEASYRFERGIDDGDTEYVLNKAAKMIAEIAGGKVQDGLISAGQTPAKQKIEIDYQKITELLGIDLTSNEITRYLKLLGIAISDNFALVPHWRHDLRTSIDLVEEVGRLHGYQNIKPIYLPKTEAPFDSIFYKQQLVKESLRDSGFSEAVTYPYLSDKDVSDLNLNKKNLITVVNPLQEEYKYLRLSLIPGLIKAVARNPIFDPVLLFEIAHVYDKDRENANLAVVASGKEAKKRLELALMILSKKLSKTINLEIIELPREQLNRFKVRKPAVYAFEIGLPELIKNAKFAKDDLQIKINRTEIAYRPISKYPMLLRDLAFIVERSVAPESITKSIYATSSMINRVELFDEYASDKLGQNMKNLAYHLFLQDMNKTLTDQEADDLLKNIVIRIEKEFQAKLRRE